MLLPSQQKGFTLLEGILGLSLLMGLLALGGQYTQRRFEERLGENATAHLRTVLDAATRYVHDQGNLNLEQEQWQQAQQQADDTDRHSLETWRYQQLIKKGYLPEYFNPQNLYGQQYAIYVKSETAPQPHKQLLLLTTGGREIGEQALRQMARQLGSQGGYLSSIEKDEDNNRCITGSLRGWQLSLPSPTLYRPPGRPENPAEEAAPADHSPGHLASFSLLYENDVLRSSSMLHRTAIPAKPELNQMESDLAMQQHQIVFKEGEYSGRLSAKILELTHASSGGSSSSSSSEGAPSSAEAAKLSLHCDASGPEITLMKADEKLAITPEQIKFSGGDLPEKWQKIVQGHSPSELHRYWNKLPYYELPYDITQSETNQFANTVCSTEIASHSEKYSTIGRLFLIGFTQHPESQLYICRHTPQHTHAPTQADRIARLGNSRKQDAKDGITRTAKVTFDTALTAAAISWLGTECALTGISHTGKIMAGTSQQIAQFASKRAQDTTMAAQKMVLLPYEHWKKLTKNSSEETFTEE